MIPGIQHSTQVLLAEKPDGVPEFWLTIFKNVDMLADMVQDHDEAILKHLQDIKVKFSQSNPMVSGQRAANLDGISLSNQGILNINNKNVRAR